MVAVKNWLRRSKKNSLAEVSFVFLRTDSTHPDRRTYLPMYTPIREASILDSMIGDETYSNHDTKRRLALRISLPSVAPTHLPWYYYTLTLSKPDISGPCYSERLA